MKISLITVSYNSESTIKETFNSVKNQLIEGYELEYIHIDGLSNDSTMDISDDYSDLISISVSEEDSGIYNAMNKGIDLATGDVIGFLNSDDTFSYSKFLRDIARLFKEKQTDIIYSDINYIDELEIIKRRWRSEKKDLFISGWHPPHPGFYAKREAFEKYGGFDEELRIAADFDLMLRFMDVHKLKSVSLNKVGVHMKLGGESNRSLEIFVKGTLIFDQVLRNMD